jgi:prepilin-type N-terminal cleavage/methylation domain-containing protein
MKPEPIRIRIRKMKKMKNKNAFTLIELLVVMAIIAALVGILSVGLRQVKIKATSLRQKGEFHGMEISIELFQNDFNGYPDSVVIGAGGVDVCGAQRLAEAMEGRDELGFHPKSKWHPDLEDSANPLYDISTNDTRKQRKPVYFELKHSGFYTPEQLWGTGSTGDLQPDQCPLITDVFVRNEPADPYNEIDEKVGTPVLYFKADPTKRFRVDETRRLVDPATQSEYTQWIYNFDDNIELLNLPWLRDTAADDDTPDVMAPHFYDPDTDYPDSTGAERFYRMITQRADTNTNYYKPWNADKYILISAGWDGKYGTKDDLTNYNY